ncbi:MAG: conjugal transfer protein TraX [Coriobacteriales bacterium]|nr:conjugal transfer protein TraX [Coriobacteriales bacterium]
MTAEIAERTNGAGGKGGVNSFVLKVIAIIGMTCDHVGIVFSGHLPPLAENLLFAPGGLTFPIMAYLLTVGYQHTRDVRRYALRLFIFALVALVPFAWAFGEMRFNVLFTLLIGLGVLYAYDHLKNRALFVLIFVAAIIISGWCDWSYIGVPMILCYHVIKDRKLRVIVPVALAWILMAVELAALLPTAGEEVIFYNLPALLYTFVGCTLTIPLLYFYNDERGRPLKYFFYTYYPAHLVLLALIRGLAFGEWL